jgi:hypothetical protein
MNIKRLSKPEDLHEIILPDPDVLPTVLPIRLDKGFNEFLKNLYPHSIPIDIFFLAMSFVDPPI